MQGGAGRNHPARPNAAQCCSTNPQLLRVSAVPLTLNTQSKVGLGATTPLDPMQREPDLDDCPASPVRPNVKLVISAHHSNWFTVHHSNFYSSKELNYYSS